MVIDFKFSVKVTIKTHSKKKLLFRFRKKKKYFSEKKRNFN